MINFDDVTKENIKENNPNWPQILDCPNRILKIRSSGSGKTIQLLNLIIHQPNIYKIYLYAKEPYEAKYQFLINKGESKKLQHLNDPKVFFEYPGDTDDICKNIEKYNLNIKLQMLIVFDDMIVDMLNNKKT